MSAQKPNPSRQERTPMGGAVLVLPVTVLLTGGAFAWMVIAAPETWKPAVAWFAGTAAVLVTVAVTVAAYGLQAARNARAQIAQMNVEAARLADEALPSLVKRLREGVSTDTALAEAPPLATKVHPRILRILAEEIGNGERMRSAAMSACASAAGRVQALSTSMLADLREMQERHGEEVLGDLMKLDHTTAQAGRLADSIAVLTGARSGRRWTKPIVMESILRGAVGRISAYQRVRVHSTSTLAIAGHAAEGVMHALAELMDNATSFSPPSEQVHVYVEEVQAGVVVAIEDGGLVMSDLALKRAERAVSDEPLDLTTLSGTRLGLAVVGCLARKHGLTVFFRPSSRGGTGVVVMIPRELLTEPKSREGDAPKSPATQPKRVAAAPERPAAVPAATSSSGEIGEIPATTDNELPKRRRGQTLAAASAPKAAADPTPSRSPAEAAARFGAFRRASRGNTEGAAQPPEDT